MTSGKWPVSQHIIYSDSTCLTVDSENTKMLFSNQQILTTWSAGKENEIPKNLAFSYAHERHVSPALANERVCLGQLTWMASGTKKMAGLLSNSKLCLCSLNFTPVGLPSHPMTCLLKVRYRICHGRNACIRDVACHLQSKTGTRLTSLLTLRRDESHVTRADRHTPKHHVDFGLCGLTVYQTNIPVLCMQ